MIYHLKQGTESRILWVAFPLYKALNS